jgi:membrane-associated phospholipid phosphatase
MTRKPDRTSTVVAEIISWVFFPPLVATVFFVFLIFWYSQDFSQGLQWIVATSPFMIFIPLAFFAVVYRLGWVTDIDFTDRRQRPAFLFVFIASLAIASVIAFFLHVPLKFFVYLFSGLVMMIEIAIISLYWKISLHTAITTSVITAVVVLGGGRFLPFYILVPFIGWARVVLKKHTVYQVIGGALLAFATTIIVFYSFGYNFLQLTF